MTDDQHADDERGLAPDPHGPAELPAPGAREDEPAQRSPWLLVGGVAVLVAVVVAGVWVLAGRGDDDVKSDADSGAGADGFWGQRWQVESIEGDAAPDLGTGAAVPDLFLDASTEGRISFTGCNGGSGGATVDGGRLVLEGEGFASTQMACTDETGPDLMAYDAWMQTFLASKPTVTVAGSRLTLASDSATAILRQVDGPTTTIPSDDPGASVSTSGPDPGGATSTVPAVVPGADDATGQDWEVTGLTVEGVARQVVPDRDGGPIVLDLTQNDLVAFNGCNGGRGSIRVEGDRLVVDGIGSTKLACTGPDGEALMAQDSAIAALLESGPTASVDGGTLTLASSAGTLTATRVG